MRRIRFGGYNMAVRILSAIQVAFLVIVLFTDIKLRWIYVFIPSILILLHTVVMLAQIIVTMSNIINAKNQSDQEIKDEEV